MTLSNECHGPVKYSSREWRASYSSRSGKFPSAILTGLGREYFHAACRNKMKTSLNKASSGSSFQLSATNGRATLWRRSQTTAVADTANTIQDIIREVIQSGNKRFYQRMDRKEKSMEQKKPKIRLRLLKIAWISYN